jgi:hypothetical protein
VALNIAALHQGLEQLEQPDPAPPPAPDQEPRDPAPKRRGLRPAPFHQAQRNLSTIEAGQHMIRARTTAYLNDPDPGRMLLIAAPAGIGKTTLAVEIAELWAMHVLGAPGSHGRVLYAGPRKDFIEDIRSISAAAGRVPPTSFDRFWYAWQGHHSGDENGLGQTCRWAAQIGQWMHRGYGAMAFCKQPRVCGWNYVNHSCAYHRQRTRPEPIIFAQYEHVSLGHPLLAECNLIIGDELPLRAFVTTTNDEPGWTIPPRAIVPEGMEPGPLEAILRALRACTTISSRDALTWHGETLLEALGGVALVADVCSSVPADALPFEPDVRGPDDVEDVPYFHVLQTAGLLRREALAHLAGREQIQRIHVDQRGLHLLLRRTPAQLPPHVIWLDATANARMYESLFQRPVEVVQPEVALRGRVYQVWASLNNKGQFLGGKAESKQARDAERKTGHIQQQIAQVLAYGYERPGYIGHKGIIDKLAPVGTPDERIGHFGGSRGTNRFQDCDCLIVVGAPQPTTAAMLDIAAMLYFERDVAFNPQWSTRDVSFEGQPWAFPMGGFWDDPDLQTLLEQYRDMELIQSVHRARPLRNAVDVWLLTNVPLRGLTTTLVSLHELFGAVAADGSPLPIREIYAWPGIVAWAEAQEQPIAAPDVMRQFGVSAPTARLYLESLIAMGNWRQITRTAPGRPGKAIIKCQAFPSNSN